MSCVRRLRIGLRFGVAAALLLTISAPALGGDEETPIVVHVERNGFHWSDAALGAFAGVGITLAVTGVVTLVRLRGAGSTTRTKGERL